MQIVRDMQPSGTGALATNLPLLRALLARAEPEDRVLVLAAASAERGFEEQRVAWLLRDPRISLFHGPFASVRLQQLWRFTQRPGVERYLPPSDAAVARPALACHSLAFPLVPSRTGLRILEVDRVDPSQGRLPAALRRSIRSSHRLVMPSRSLAGRLLARLAEESPRLANDAAVKLAIVPHGVESTFRGELPAGRVEELYRRHPALEDRYVLAAGAAASPRRDLELLVTACVQARQSGHATPRLVVAAESNDLESIVDLLRAREATEHALVVEPLPAEMRPALVRGAEAVLFPATDGAFGAPVIEAAALGVRALVGRGCGAVELLRDATAERLVAVVDGDTPSHWSRALVALGRDTGRTQGSDPAEAVAVRTWDDVADDLWHLYRTAVRAS
jgi:glycosyltransferase involved in cell wall biosynthesis